ncbi:MAG TPA: hypothetical protein VLT61_10485 [Anaeromyxobacteraceae bacterium]|nr:hypothetical protein [Anaeromyxobacteraceae bacterium]
MMIKHLVAMVAALAAGVAGAADPSMKPFVLAQRAAGEPAAVVAGVKAKLEGAGFRVAGVYTPYSGATVIAVTSDDLLAAAAKNRFGAYGAVQRVGVTKVGDEVQVAYTNPAYMQHGYRMTGDLATVAQMLQAALGRLEEFGSKDGKTAKQLRKYHYMVGMEYFDEPTALGKFGNQAEALAAVEAGLAAKRGGTSKVYRVDVPGADETVFGVALTEGCSGDGFIMKEIDAKPTRSTGHLPYEIVVSKGEVFALYARFRIALNFPDLSMMGSNSFMNIRCAPDAIASAFKKVVGK